MKKLFLTLGVACLALSSFASERILYQQNFETAPDVAATGWEYGGTSISIVSDKDGKFLQLNEGNTNDRSGRVYWGQEIYLKDGESVLENGTYTMMFDFSIGANSNNHYNSEITVFTNNAPKWNLNGNYRPANNNFIFDLSQCTTEADDDNMHATINAPLKDDGAIDTSNPYTLEKTNWYTATMNVNVNTRKVEYSVVDLSGNELTSGTMTVPENDANGEPVSMFAEGIFVLTARYYSIINIDNIKIYFDSEYDYANEPTVALTRLGKTENDELDLNLRAYTITFLDGETLHVTGTDGQTVDVEWADCDGAYIYETTTSGTLTAWTTCGEATSEKVEVEVECVPCQLPPVVATISSVEAGFGKTYTLSVENSNVPLQPTIAINYEFIGEDGKNISAEGVYSGEKVTVTGKGTLKLTSESYGYQATTVSVDNDTEFEVKKTYDFARMTEEQIKAAGFPAFKTLNSGKTSGFDNWTARQRLFYYDKNTAKVDEESGETVYDKALPFGFISEDNTTNVIEYAVIDAADNTAKSEHFEGIDVYMGYNLGILHHIGLYNDQTSKPDSKPVVVKDLDETDFVYVNKMNNYGGDSSHPIVETVEEYYQQLKGAVDEVYSVAEKGTLNEKTGKYNLEFSVYRVDTALTEVIIYSPVSGGSAVEAVESVKAGDNNWYSIDGVRVAQPTHPGLYIHNGKKIIVK